MGEKPASKQARLHAIVHGRVQGVNFRYATLQAADRLRLTGWVANRWNGTVETVAEGPSGDLETFLSFLHRGPPSAWVDRVDANWQAATGEFTDFRVQFI
ncbi:MAG: acylphosphatase [Anaerolineae bacterium]|nr:acylphosphatase [Anaerolineae bacterium]